MAKNDGTLKPPIVSVQLLSCACMTWYDSISRQLAIVWYCTIIIVFYYSLLAYCLLLQYCPPVRGVYNAAPILVRLSK
jgi:hypothetical protein